MKINEKPLFSLIFHDGTCPSCRGRGLQEPCPRRLMPECMPTVSHDGSGAVREFGGRPRRVLPSANLGYIHLSRNTQYNIILNLLSSLKNLTIIISSKTNGDVLAIGLICLFISVYSRSTTQHTTLKKFRLT